MRLTALRSLYFEGAIEGKSLVLRQAIAARTNEHGQAKHVLGLDPGMGTGSPSGHASKRRETWLFENLN